MSAAAQVSPVNEYKAYYDKFGYVVLPRQVPAPLIDKLLGLYQKDILPSKTKFYRQNTNVYDTNRFTEHGHVIQSFLDVHHYKKFPTFRQAALDLYFSDELLQGLRDVTGHPGHNLMQSMLFDANAATPPHQDWWYLDTVPQGQLVGAWIALEDIEEAAGRFYVLAGSHKVHLHEANLPHSEWLARMRKHVDEHRADLHVPALKKGDVLIWNSGTIHGSLETQDRRFSRKSLTAHFMPSHMTFGNLFTAKPWVNYEEAGGHKYFANQPEYSIKAAAVSGIKQALYDSPRVLRILRKFQRRSVSSV